MRATPCRRVPHLATRSRSCTRFPPQQQPTAAPAAHRPPACPPYPPARCGAPLPPHWARLNHALFCNHHLQDATQPHDTSSDDATTDFLTRMFQVWGAVACLLHAAGVPLLFVAGRRDGWLRGCATAAAAFGGGLTPRFPSCMQAPKPGSTDAADAYYAALMRVGCRSCPLLTTGRLHAAAPLLGTPCAARGATATTMAPTHPFLPPPPCCRRARAGTATAASGPCLLWGCPAAAAR